MKKIWGFLLVAVLILGAGVLSFVGGKNGEISVHASPASHLHLKVLYHDDYRLMDSGEPDWRDLSYQSESTYRGEQPIREFDNLYEAGAIVGTTGWFAIHLNGQDSASTDWIRVGYSEPLPKSVEDSIKDLDNYEKVLYFEAVYEALDYNYEHDGNKYWDTALASNELGELHYLSVKYEELGFYRIEINTTRDDNGNKIPYQNVYVFTVRDQAIIDEEMFVTTFTSTGGYTAINYLHEADAREVKKIDIKVQKNASVVGRFTPDITSIQTLIIVNSTTNETVCYFDQDENKWVGMFKDPVVGVNSIVLNLKDGQTLGKGSYVLSYDISVEQENIHGYGYEQEITSKTLRIQALFTLAIPVESKINWWYILLAIVVLGALGGGIYGINKLLAYSQTQHEKKMETAREERRQTEQENIAKLRARMNREE